MSLTLDFKGQGHILFPMVDCMYRSRLEVVSECSTKLLQVGRHNFHKNLTKTMMIRFY